METRTPCLAFFEGLLRVPHRVILLAEAPTGHCRLGEGSVGNTGTGNRAIKGIAASSPSWSLGPGWPATLRPKQNLRSFARD